jgi:hypothetical protein
MSTPSNATADAVYGQLYNFSGVIRSFSTGNPISSGLSGLSAMISKSDAAFVATANSPVEVGTDSGVFSLDLTAAEMTNDKLVVVVSSTASNAISWVVQINPRLLGKFTGRYDAQAVLRMEQMLQDVFILLGANGASQTGAALTFLNPDGSTHFGGSVVQNTTSGVRSLME